MKLYFLLKLNKIIRFRCYSIGIYWFIFVVCDPIVISRGPSIRRTYALYRDRILPITKRTHVNRSAPSSMLCVTFSLVLDTSPYSTSPMMPKRWSTSTPRPMSTLVVAASAWTAAWNTANRMVANTPRAIAIRCPGGCAGRRDAGVSQTYVTTTITVTSATLPYLVVGSDHFATHARVPTSAPDRPRYNEDVRAHVPVVRVARCWPVGARLSYHRHGEREVVL